MKRFNATYNVIADFTSLTNSYIFANGGKSSLSLNLKASSLMAKHHG